MPSEEISRLMVREPGAPAVSHGNRNRAEIWISSLPTIVRVCRGDQVLDPLLDGWLGSGSHSRYPSGKYSSIAAIESGSTSDIAEPADRNLTVSRLPPS